MDATQLLAFRQAAEEAARQGAAVLEQWRSRFQVREKGKADFVTEADVAAQHAIRAVLLGRFPAHGFLGEEDPTHLRPPADAPPTWIVDPLDGTTNYVHDVPLYCVSIGLQVAGELVVGVVYDPRQRELFSAARGQGTNLNGRPVRVSTTADLGQALLATGFAPDLVGTERTLDWWRYFAFRTQSLRRTGTTAINLAWLAVGRFDGYYAFDNKVWDVAGGLVLVTEAGGRATAIDGSICDPFAPACVVSNGPLHPALLTAFRDGP